MTDKKDKKDTFCHRADTELIMRSFSEKLEVHLCCKSQRPVVYDTFEKGSEAIQKVRDDLNNGVRNNHCNYCWFLEDKGLESWRHIGNARAANYYTMEIYVDNTCDLECIYCGPKYSSKWQQTIQNSSLEDRNVLANSINDAEKPLAVTKTAEQRAHHKQMILQQCEEMGRNAKAHHGYEIVFLGGEPLLTSTIKKDIVSEVIEAVFKYADPESNVGIIIVTNGNTPENIMHSTIDKLANFRNTYPNLRIQIHISVESTGPNAEFVRYGAKWETIKRNFEMWMEAGSSGRLRLTTGLCLTISAVSLFDTVNVLEYAFQQAIKHNTSFTPAFNPITFPQFLSVGVYPPDEYNYVFDEIEEVVRKYHHHMDPRIADKVYEQLNNSREILGKFKFPDTIRKGKLYFDWIERSRGLKVQDVNPILYKILTEDSE